jgi:hypothetical protein
MLNTEEEDLVAIDAKYAEAEVLADRIMLVLGLVPDDHAAWIGRINRGVAGTALGIAAGRIMSSLSDDNFLHWINALSAERARTRAYRLSEH